MNKWLLLLAVFATPLFLDAHAQFEFNVTETTPCFLNYNNSGIEFLQDCNLDTDQLGATTVWAEWVTGGLFSMIIVAILIFMTWVKYHTPFYPILIGLVFLPTAGYLFPDVFVSSVIMLMVVGIAGIVWYIMVRRTQG